MKNNLPKDIIMDIDDVICDTSTLMIQAINDFTKQSKTIDEWVNFDLSKVYDNLKHDDVHYILHHYNVFRDCEPCVGAKQSVDWLIGEGFRIHYCTARKNVVNAEVTTEEWFDRHDINKSCGIHYVEYGTDKSLTYKQISNKFAYMFDDNIANIHDAIVSDLIHKPVLITKPWNKNHNFEGIRVDSLYDFCQQQILKFVSSYFLKL